MNLQTTRSPLILAGITGILMCVCGPAFAEEQQLGSIVDVELATELDRASYILGYEQSKALDEQTQGVLNLAAYIAGIRDFGSQAPRQVPISQQQQLMTVLNNAVGEKQNAVGAAIIAAGQALLAENGSKSGVTTLASGLQYEVLTEADGPKPAPEDTVVTHYHGSLPDGTTFDSSIDRGQPASFRVDRVIAGWTEALQLMSVGSKWRLVIPSNLAYGPQGAGGSIPPNATLVFEVELLDIKK